eukprot:NODE_17949_length_918_cov_6.771176.p2 GENE.NODE_17949_length_918_cov_6.771176~~NODE_17949_length_918_cov_6.771176.p2  ORF type:complete len:238 (+),score=70.03 NODE_17949_length_918_cov_6.771176:59-715(+)
MEEKCGVLCHKAVASCSADLTSFRGAMQHELEQLRLDLAREGRGVDGARDLDRGMCDGATRSSPSTAAHIAEQLLSRVKRNREDNATWQEVLLSPSKSEILRPRSASTSDANSPRPDGTVFSMALASMLEEEEQAKLPAVEIEVPEPPFCAEARSPEADCAAFAAVAGVANGHEVAPPPIVSEVFEALAEAQEEGTPPAESTALPPPVEAENGLPSGA